MESELKIKKIKKGFYHMYVHEDKTYMPNLSIENAYIPFGIEEYKDKIIVNVECDNGSDFFKVINPFKKTIHFIYNIIIS